jgi:hypothetical protein
MSPTHCYQVMPDVSPEEYAALKGVRIPIDVDEGENIIDLKGDRFAHGPA